MLRYVAAPAVRLRICHIEAAAGDRPAGYLDAVLGAGVRDGEWLEMSDDAYRDLVTRFAPSPEALAARAGRAIVKWIASGAHIAPDELHWTRACVCAMCPLWDARRQRCLQCGCYGMKLHLASESCPIGRW